jgi:hypothetical protein
MKCILVKVIQINNYFEKLNKLLLKRIAQQVDKDVVENEQDFLKQFDHNQ